MTTRVSDEHAETTTAATAATAAAAASSAPAPPAVILVRPQEEGNVGAVARAMANMGLSELVLVEPAPRLGATARAFAVKARHLLDGARREPSLRAALAPYQRVVGTTSGRNRELDVPLLTARELGERLAADPGPATALVFGPEASGLTGEELAHCGALVTIPCDSRQPTLNLAQAVLLVAYELATARRADRRAPSRTGRPAPVAQVDGLFDQLSTLLRRVGFARDDTFDGVLGELRRLAARAEPTDREVSLLRGVCRRTGNTLDRLEKEREGEEGR